MTGKQIERIQLKIKKIKSELAADKRRWGGHYDDSRGLRYLPPQYYIKLEDYKGGLRYLNWFDKNFPDDIGSPDFLFESTVILFQRKKYKEAEKKAFETFCSNTYIFDMFFGKPIIAISKYEGSNIESPDFLIHFSYSCEQPFLAEFRIWLHTLISSTKFKEKCQKYIEIYTQLKDEHDIEKRKYLIQNAQNLKTIND